MWTRKRLNIKTRKVPINEFLIWLPVSWQPRKKRDLSQFLGFLVSK